MKNSIIVLLTMISSTAAMADGFICTSQSGLNLKVYNHTSASQGTRTAAVLVISNSNVGAGNKVIAKFTDVKGTLTSKSQIYTANVDLRFSDSNRKGELIGGTKLGELDQIELAIDFSYSQPLANGEETSAVLTLVKRNDSELVENVNCIRYLKN